MCQAHSKPNEEHLLLVGSKAWGRELQYGIKTETKGLRTLVFVI